MDKLKAMAGFVRIAERGSLTAAATELGTSLPSMVRTLAALERELGVTLLNRTTRRMHLTDAGREYLTQCRTILGQVEEAEAMLHARRAAPQGRLALTASVLFGTRFVAPLMHEFVMRHPLVTGELLFVDRIVNLVEEGLDVGIRIGRLEDSSLVALPLGAVRRVVCASPAYLRAKGVPHQLEDVPSHQSVRFTGLTPLDEWDFGPVPHRVAIRSALICNLPEVAIEACVRGLGLGMFLSYMVSDQVRAGRLQYVLEAYEPQPVPVSLVYPHSRHVSPTVRAFADLCLMRLRHARFD